MSRTVFDLVGNLDTLLAVTVGAVLATLGALFAEIIQDRMDRKRRERDAARFFGEVLTTIDRTIEIALNSQKVGDPWGGVTMRMFKMAQREAGVYARNRERLFEIRDTDLRAQIHTHFLSELFPLDALIDHSAEIAEIEDVLEEQKGLSPERMAKLASIVGYNKSARERAVVLLEEERAKTAALCHELEKIAKVNFRAPPR